MHTFTPIPFTNLLRRMRREAEISQSIFDLPKRSWFFPVEGFDFSAKHISKRASTPVGPAAGPHTQLAQNIVLSWLAGGRILELKTVQVNDRLEIPRPTMHITQVGYNVEWSQELSVPESLAEYAKAVYLIEILKRTRGFGAFAGAADFESSADTVYDISVGYDHDGIRSEKVTGFLRALQNPAPHFAELRRELASDLCAFHDVELPPAISDCVTLSTFHGCPANQIEAIVRYLMESLGFHVIIKFNPTLLGFDAVQELLFDCMGYHHLSLRREAFEQDLQYDDALEMLRRLRLVAKRCGRSVGAKFTNTLVVANNPKFFPTQSEPYMYLSGKPLHVLAMNLMQRFREDAGFEFPVSFSAGIDSRNFSSAVACGMVPVTTCTDLLRQGGYARLPRYLHHLADEMKRVHVTSREAFVLSAKGHAVEAMETALCSIPGGAQVWEKESSRLIKIAGECPDRLPLALRETAAAAGLDGEALALKASQIAGRLNARDIVPAIADDPRYHAPSNKQEPRRIARTLQLYDCINCDLCISACPNDAMFSYDVRPVERATELLRFDSQGTLLREPGRGFKICESLQLAVIADLCNECSNCDVYCPEEGAPFQRKEQVFASLRGFRRVPLRDGFCREDNALLVRLRGMEMSLAPDPASNRAQLCSHAFRLELRWDSLEVLEGCATNGAEVTLDTSDLWRMKTVWEFIFNSALPNWVNPDPANHLKAQA